MCNCSPPPPRPRSGAPTLAVHDPHGGLCRGGAGGALALPLPLPRVEVSGLGGLTQGPVPLVPGPKPFGSQAPALGLFALSDGHWPRPVGGVREHTVHANRLPRGFVQNGIPDRDISRALSQTAANTGAPQTAAAHGHNGFTAAQGQKCLPGESSARDFRFQRATTIEVAAGWCGVMGRWAVLGQSCVWFPLRRQSAFFRAPGCKCSHPNGGSGP